MIRWTLIPAFLLSLPLAAQENSSLIADFESGPNAAQGPLNARGGETSLAPGSPLGGSSWSLRFQGAAPASAQSAQLTLHLASGGRSVDILRRSPSRQLILSYRAQAGASFSVCLQGTLPAGGACATITAPDNAWHEVALDFPGVEGGTEMKAAFKGELSKAAAVTVSPLGDQPFDLLLDDLRFDPPAPSHDPAAVAAAFGASESAVREAYRLNLAETLTWTLVYLSGRCACSPAQMMEERKTRSWGEVAQAHGIAWGELVEELERRAEAAGLSPNAPTLTQELRTASNDPDKLAQSPDEP